MSVEKVRKHRKLSDGSYNTMHEESSSDIILRPDGTTVESIIQALISGKVPYYNKYGQDCGAAADIVETSITTGTFTDYPPTGADGQGTVITIFYCDGWVKQYWVAPYDTATWYRTKSNTEKYSDWRYIYDTVFKPSAGDIGAVYDLKRNLSVTDMNNANYPYPYMASLQDSLAPQLGLPITCWYHLMNFRHQDNNGFNAQLAISLNAGTPNIYCRTSSGTNWSSWYGIPCIQFGTADIGAGASLPTGTMYLMYE